MCSGWGRPERPPCRRRTGTSYALPLSKGPKRAGSGLRHSGRALPPQLQWAGSLCGVAQERGTDEIISDFRLLSIAHREEPEPMWRLVGESGAPAGMLWLVCG